MQSLFLQKCLKPLLVSGEFFKVYFRQKLFSAIKKFTPSKILTFLYLIFRQEEDCFTFLDNKLSCNLVIFRSNWRTTISSIFWKRCLFLTQKLLH